MKKIANRARNELHRRLIAQIKDKPCHDCGGMFMACCMDFDHIRGEKKFNISERHGNSMASLIAEIEKCDLVCANCHRIRTSNRMVPTL